MRPFAQPLPRRRAQGPRPGRRSPSPCFDVGPPSHCRCRLVTFAQPFRQALTQPDVGPPALEDGAFAQPLPRRRAPGRRTSSRCLDVGRHRASPRQCQCEREAKQRHWRGCQNQDCGSAGGAEVENGGGRRPHVGDGHRMEECTLADRSSVAQGPRVPHTVSASDALSSA